MKLSELLQYNLQSVRSHLMREDFQQFWDYTYPACAAKFLDEWETRTQGDKDRHYPALPRTFRRHSSILTDGGFVR